VRLAARRAHAPDARARPEDACSLLLARCAGFEEGEHDQRFCWQVTCSGCPTKYYGCDLSSERTNEKGQQVFNVWDCRQRAASAAVDTINRIRRGADAEDKKKAQHLVRNALSKAEKRKLRNALPKAENKKAKLDAGDDGGRRPALTALDGNSIIELGGKTVIELEAISENIAQRLAAARAADTLEVKEQLAGDLTELGVRALEELDARAKAVGIDAEHGTTAALEAALEAARDKRNVEGLLANDAALALLDLGALGEVVERAAAFGLDAGRAQSLKAALEREAIASQASVKRNHINILRAACKHARMTCRKRAHSELAAEYPVGAIPRKIQIELDKLARTFATGAAARPAARGCRRRVQFAPDSGGV